MITVLVTYKLPAGMDRAAAAKLSEDTAPKLQALAGQGLRTKHFLIRKLMASVAGSTRGKAAPGPKRSIARPGSILWKSAWGRDPS